MTVGTVILLGLVVAEVVTLVKVGRQNERIKKLEAEGTDEKKAAKGK